MMETVKTTMTIEDLIKDLTRYALHLVRSVDGDAEMVDFENHYHDLVRQNGAIGQLIARQLVKDEMLGFDLVVFEGEVLPEAQERVLRQVLNKRDRHLLKHKKLLLITLKEGEFRSWTDPSILRGVEAALSFLRGRMSRRDEASEEV